MPEKVEISGVELLLSEPANVDMKWVGNDDFVNQLKAAWMIVDKEEEYCKMAAKRIELARRPSLERFME